MQATKTHRQQEKMMDAGLKRRNVNEDEAKLHLFKKLKYDVAIASLRK